MLFISGCILCSNRVCFQLPELMIAYKKTENNSQDKHFTQVKRYFTQVLLKNVKKWDMVDSVNKIRRQRL